MSSIPPITVFEGGGGNPNQGTGDDVGNDPVTVDPGGDGDGPVIGNGDGPTTYEYSIEDLHLATGSAYVASESSTIICNSSVAVFTRLTSFASRNTSTMVSSNCCSYAALRGFVCLGSSRMRLDSSVASVSAQNFSAAASSSLLVTRCASVFPVLTGVLVSRCSTFDPTNFDSMTVVWANFDPAAQRVPTHFHSEKNSFCSNNSTSLSSRSAISGLSGSLLNNNPISFMWSQISGGGGGLAVYSPLNPVNGAFNLFEDAPASYRFVPRSHSTDWNALISGGGGPASAFPNTAPDTSTLTLLLTQNRDCYTSVKPPTWLYPPEDFSGARTFTGSFSAYLNFNLSNVLNSLI